MWIALILLLLLFSIWDLKEKAVPVWILLATIAATTTVSIIVQEGPIGHRLLKVMAAMLPGAGMTLTAFLFRGKMGSGDGLVLVGIGNLTGWKISIWILFTAIFLSFAYSCLLLVCKRGREYCFPFIPFYLCAAVVVWIFAY